MPLFREKRFCPWCKADLKQPREGESAVCPVCGAPGPWALGEDHERHRQALAERAAAEAAIRYQRLRKALELQPIDAPGFIAHKGETVYLNEPARLAEWKKGAATTKAGAGSVAYP
jgi:uncharacterized Zn finger protein (UPF0148 family)